jgi:hypothetical protein
MICNRNKLWVGSVHIVWKEQTSVNVGKTYQDFQ